jgi:hypothetical protein
VARPARRSPWTRLILTLAALASVLAGYYLGQYWQRRPLADLSAVIYPAGQSVEYPAGLGIIDTDTDAKGPWRLFLPADTRVTECAQLLRHYASVFNRLAVWPEIQANLRLSVLAYDQPDAAAATAFTAGVSWAEVFSAGPQELDALSRQLGILPDHASWCSATVANAVLVAPDQKRWALIPYEQAAIMAHNISTIIAFVE